MTKQPCKGPGLSTTRAQLPLASVSDVHHKAASAAQALSDRLASAKTATMALVQDLAPVRPILPGATQHLNATAYEDNIAAPREARREQETGRVGLYLPARTRAASTHLLKGTLGASSGELPNEGRDTTHGTGVQVPPPVGHPQVPLQNAHQNQAQTPVDTISGTNTTIMVALNTADAVATYLHGPNPS